MKILKSCLICIPFFLILGGGFILGFMQPDEPISLVENRELMQRPKLDFHHISQFATDYTTYVVEQFPFREEFLKEYTMAQLFMGKKYIRNTYVAQEEWLLPTEYQLSSSEIETYCNALLQHISKEKFATIDFYYAILPFKTASLFPLEESYVDMKNGLVNRERIVAMLTQSPIRVIDVQKYFNTNFSLEDRKQFYFKTDFHWNALGAYAAMQCIQNTMVQSGSLDEQEQFQDNDFDFIYLDHTKYQGDLNLWFSNAFSMAETIPLIQLKDRENVQYYLKINATETVNREDVIASDINKKLVNYNDVYTENLGYYRCIHPNAKSNKKIIIFKDSLQNPTVDMFSQIFQEVHVIDARNYQDIYGFEELLSTVQPDVVLFMFHQNNTSKELKEYLTT